MQSLIIFLLLLSTAHLGGNNTGGNNPVTIRAGGSPAGDAQAGAGARSGSHPG